MASKASSERKKKKKKKKKKRKCELEVADPFGIFQPKSSFIFRLKMLIWSFYFGEFIIR